MKAIRFTWFAIALLVLAILPIVVSAQTVTDENGTVIKVHRFEPTVPAAAGADSDASTRKGDLSISAQQQIGAMVQEKQSRTAAQNKISSRLLFTARMLQGQPAVPGVPVLRSGLEVDDQNNLLVDITAVVSDDLLQRLRSKGVRIIQAEARFRFIRALIPPAQLELIAAYPDVTFISPRREARTMGGGTKSPRPINVPVSPGFSDRAARLRAKLSKALAGQGVSPLCLGQGSVVSEGLDTHQVSDACVAYGFAGAGVTIGVISDGVSSLALSQATGDLPPTCPAGPPCVTVLPGQVGSGDEGTAMLEIIHDLLPQANLYFATALPSNGQFAQNILDLRSAGCDIIVDDIIYFIESPFQDGQAPSVVSEFDGGIVTQAVNDVVADGAMYFSSAGNEGNKDDASFGLNGTYEGDFVDGGTNSLLPVGRVHKFGPGTTAYDPVASFGGDYVWLYWSDPLGASGNDYDFYVLNSAGTLVVDGSNQNQTGTQDPVEGFGATAFQGERIVVWKLTASANRFFHLVAFNAGLTVGTQGAVYGHAGGSGAIAVAATPADLPITTGFPSGPWPDPFSSTDVVEPYSSDGPRRIFFEADGTAITPGNFSSTGGRVLQKPEITAADGVSVTGVGGFPSPFYGTSAAAPHAAAIAGLLLSSDDTLTNTDIVGFLTGTAIDIMGTGVDRDSGAGIIMALPALVASLAPKITSLSPVSGDVGTPVTITGEHFGATQSTSTVTFNGTAATTITNWSDTSITAQVPTGATSGNVVVTVGGVASNGVLFTVTPHITNISPTSGTVGVPVTITGTNFGATQGSSTVKFNGVSATPTSWSATSIVAPAPLGVSTGNVVVAVNSIPSNGVNFTFVPPAITSLDVTSAPVGAAVTITGTSFGPARGASTVKFNGTAATVTSWSDTSLSTTVPAGATSGNVVVNVNSTDSNGSSFTVQDFAFQAALTDISVTAGQSGSEDFTIDSVTGFDAAISLTCSGAPSKSTCTLNPTSIASGGTPATVHLSIATTAATTSGVGAGQFGIWLPFGGLGLVLVAGAGARKRNRKALATFSLFLLLPLLAAIVSCGGSSHHTIPGTPPGTYTMTVTASSGATSHSTTFHLTVH